MIPSMEARQLLMLKRMHTLVTGNSWARVALGAATFWMVIHTGFPNASAQSTTAGRANDYGFSQVSLINEQIRRGWIEQGLKPSEMATDGEWCRRVYLDILGRIPSVEELRRFTERRDAAKKRKLVEELLEGEEYSDEYAAQLVDNVDQCADRSQRWHGTEQSDEPRRHARLPPRGHGWQQAV